VLDERGVGGQQISGVAATWLLYPAFRCHTSTLKLSKITRKKERKILLQGTNISPGGWRLTVHLLRFVKIVHI
jgi:hypothetical protein